MVSRLNEKSPPGPPLSSRLRRTASSSHPTTPTEHATHIASGPGKPIGRICSEIPAGFSPGRPPGCVAGRDPAIALAVRTPAMRARRAVRAPPQAAGSVRAPSGEGAAGGAPRRIAGGQEEDLHTLNLGSFIAPSLGSFIAPSLPNLNLDSFAEPEPRLFRWERSNCLTQMPMIGRNLKFSRRSWPIPWTALQSPRPR